MGTCIQTSFQNRICSNEINNVRKTSISMVSESDIWGNIIDNIRGTRISMVL